MRINLSVNRKCHIEKEKGEKQCATLVELTETNKKNKKKTCKTIERLLIFM